MLMLLVVRRCCGRRGGRRGRRRGGRLIVHRLQFDALRIAVGCRRRRRRRLRRRHRLRAGQVAGRRVRMQIAFQQAFGLELNAATMQSVSFWYEPNPACTSHL